VPRPTTGVGGWGHGQEQGYRDKSLAMTCPQVRSAELSQPETSPSGTPATHVRWVLMALTAATTAVSILGRLNIGVLAKYIQDEFGFGTQTMRWIFGAFAFSYHPFQIPGGWAADRYGPRKVLTFSILWWAVFTAAVAMEPRLPMSRWVGWLDRSRFFAFW
jgi:sugar phosphate permease